RRHRARRQARRSGVGTTPRRRAPRPGTRPAKRAPVRGQASWLAGGSSAPRLGGSVPVPGGIQMTAHKERVTLFGASGTMGYQAFLELQRRAERYDVTLLLVP